MRRSYKLQDLECANCAAKMEADLNKLTAVNNASISFMTSKLVLDVEPENLECALSEAQRIVSRYEPDCVIAR